MNITIFAEVSGVNVIGGAERVLHNNAVGFKKMGHHVELIVRAPDSEAEPIAYFDEIAEHRFFPLQSNPLSFVWSTVFDTLTFFKNCAKKNRPDVVIIHQSLVGLGPILFRRMLAKKWIYICHSHAHEEYVTRNKPGNNPLSQLIFFINTKLRYFIEKYVIYKCDNVIVLSQFMKNRVMNTHGVVSKKISIVPGGTEIDKFTVPEDRKVIRKNFNIPESSILFFTVRNLVPRMGLENLIAALGPIKEKYKDFRLIIGGRGPLLEKLTKLRDKLSLTENISFAGFIPEEDLPLYYQTADLMILPTKALEGFGLVTVEALSCGTPVLGTPVGATPEILTQLDPRLVADGYDAESLKKSIVTLTEIIADKPDEWNNLRGKAAALVREKYNWQRHNNEISAKF